MKKIIITILLVLLAWQALPQRYSWENSITGIVIIDRKLPLDLWGSLSYKDSLQNTHSVNFTYRIGLFIFDDGILSVLRTLPDTCKIEIHLNFRERDRKGADRVYHYTTSFTMDWLLTEQFIFSVTNFNKKKSIYYVDWISNTDFHKFFTWKKEYGSRRRSYEKVKKYLFPIYIPFEGKMEKLYP